MMDPRPVRRRGRHRTTARLRPRCSSSRRTSPSSAALSRDPRRENREDHGSGDEATAGRSSASTIREARGSRRASSRSADTPTSSGEHPGVGGRAADLAVMGPCAGGAVYSPAITDFVFMVEGSSYMFITGPDVVKTVTGEEVTKEDLGGAVTHAAKSGVAHSPCPDEEACLEDARYLLSFLPQNDAERPPWCGADRPARSRGRRARPADPGQPEQAVRHARGHPARRRRRRVPRGAAALRREHPLRVRAARRAFGRRRRQPAALLAGRARHRLHDKAARFVRTCDAFNVPLVTFDDVPGSCPGRRRSGAGSSVTARSCSTPTARRRCRS